MNEVELSPLPLLVLHLRGSQSEMGRQHGALLARVGGYDGVTRFYPSMAARMLTHGFPHWLRPPSERVARALLFGMALHMHGHRRTGFAEYVARTEALLAAGSVPSHMGPSLLVMEVLQNTVGLLSRAGVLPAARFSAVGVPACSSLAVWGEASSDGALRHARNFDFPGAGVWDHAPCVVFCDPDEGLRYGFVSTRGADVPGITAFNEAGLTLTVHTRFHRDIRFDGPAVFDLGHDIARRASSLGEAVSIARRLGSASTWGILVSSAREKSAVLIETTAKRVAVVEPEPGAAHLSCTNRYLAPELKHGEVSTSEAFVADANARRRRLEEAVLEAGGGLDAEGLEALLGDLRAPDARDADDTVPRLSGDCITSPISVQSIVAEPESERVRVSIGRAPSGFGPFVPVSWSWQGAPRVWSLRGEELVSHARAHRGRPLRAEERASARAYAEIARLNLEGASPIALRPRLEALVRTEPREPGFRTLAGLVCVAASDLEAALSHFEAALASEHGPRRRGLLLLFKTRVLAALGRVSEATRARDELLAMSDAECAAQRSAARREKPRPPSKRALRQVVIDFHLIDGRVPGVDDRA